MNNLKGYWVLSKVSGPKRSDITGDYFEVEMIDADTKKPYKSYIVDENFNRHNWHDVIEEHWGVYTGIRTKRARGKVVINADSKPILAEKLSREECKNFAMTGSI
tara:strand:+ start:1579 stop:1893 length:315 start_codon:yes stop_codon:yes gene_type:complete